MRRRRGSVFSKPCAITPCPKKIADSDIMCVAHWAFVPGTIQQEFYHADRLAMLHPGDLRLRNKLNVAKQKAIDSLTTTSKEK